MSSFAFVKLFNAIHWSVEPITLIPASGIEKLEAGLKTETSVFIANNISKLIWQKRLQAGKKIDKSSLVVGKVRAVHLPGEPFVKYQLAAKALKPNLFVTVAGYGDYGLGHIGTAVAYGEGGYETGQASGVTTDAE